MLLVKAFNKELEKQLFKHMHAQYLEHPEINTQNH